MTLLSEILGLFPGVTHLNRDDAAIAAAVTSARPKKVVHTEVGKGAIIDTIGLQSANALLDLIDTAPDYRHVKQLLENGWFNIGSPLARLSLDALVGSVITADEADRLKALAEIPDVVSVNDVSDALNLAGY